MIEWPESKIYDKYIIDHLIKNLKKNMDGIFPLYGNEKRKLISYAKNNNLSYSLVASVRNMIKIQLEINYSKHRMSKSQIIQNLTQSVKSIMSCPNNSNLKKFILSTKTPINNVIKIIKSSPLYNQFPERLCLYLTDLQNINDKNQQKSAINARKFEIKLENYITKSGIIFKTESDIKADYVNTSDAVLLTPDILFNEPIDIIFNNRKYKINWMDAKNYFLADIPFVIQNLRKQNKKYIDAYGPGAFVFHYGYQDGIKIPNVLILTLN